MGADKLLKRLFPHGWQGEIDQYVITGSAITSAGKVRIVGTVNAAPIDQAIAIRLSAEILSIIKEGNQEPVVFVVDTQGQALSRTDELLCLNRTFAHLASCVDWLRRAQHPNLAVIFGQAVSGGFLSYGLMANEVFAFDNSQVKVMDLNAMSRVTKIPVERLQELAQSSPVFAPGVENFYRMGAVDEIVHAVGEDDFIGAAIQRQQADLSAFVWDKRKDVAMQRHGRMLCQQLVQAVLEA